LHKLLLVRVVRGLGVFEQREVDSLLAGKDRSAETPFGRQEPPKGVPGRM